MNLATARRRFLPRSLLELAAPAPHLRARIREAFGAELTPIEVVRSIIAAVRQRGDAALNEYSSRLDGVSVTELEVTPAEWEQALRETPPELTSALEVAAERVRRYCESDKPQVPSPMAVELSKMVLPLEKVGLYIPGGTAVYPSTVLMSALPARVAGVREVIVATPPRPSGQVAPAVLTAARIAGVHRVFKMGGAQAIAALAFGTQSVPQVDKICGPGNIFVLLAKREVFGYVAIDGLYGPTETVVLADDSATPQLCAAELLAQAEHDVLASAILITLSQRIAHAVNREVELQLPHLERRDLTAQALQHRGGIIVAADLGAATEFINDFAPEHLSLMLADPASVLNTIRNAGCIFVGGGEAFGDYVAGPSHILPTAGTARFSSPLRVADFLKETIVIALSAETQQRTGPAALTIAWAEGLTAHAAAVAMKLSQLGVRDVPTG